MSRRFSTVAVLSAALGLAACGSSTTHSSTATGTAGAVTTPATTASTTATTATSATTPTASTTPTTTGATTGATTSSGPLTPAAFKALILAGSGARHALGLQVGRAVQTAKQHTDAQLAAEFSGLAARARAFQGELASIQAPAADASLVRAYAAAFGAAAGDLENIAHAAGAHDGTTAEAATRQLIKDGVRISTTGIQLKKRVLAIK